jgi:AcrR family transcriptional regulator
MKRATRTSGDIRRVQIKQAAKEIIFEEGLQKLSTRNIAAKVGISEGTIFRHFGTKKEILLDLVSDVKTELFEPLHEIANHDDTPDKRLHDYICYHISYLAKNKGITILFFTEASYQNNEVLKTELGKIYIELKQNFAKIITDGINAGLWDPDVPAENLSGLYMGIPLTLNIEFTLNPENFLEENFCNKMHSLLLKILRK